MKRPQAILLASVLAILAADAESLKDTRPNILFFFTDDRRHDTLGCAGHPIVETPTIDRLAENGVRFSIGRA